jgi:hypothetical protein
MIRPSVSSTKTVRFSAQALMAAGSTVSFPTVIGMIFLREEIAVLEHHLLYSANDRRWNFLVPSKPNRGQPELTFPFGSIDGYVRWFVSFIRVKVEAKSTDSEYRRHGHLQTKEL